jgi:hypothetical protein
MDGIDSNGCVGNANRESAKGTMLAATTIAATVPEKLPRGKNGLKSTTKAENPINQPRFWAFAAWKAMSSAPKLTRKRSGSWYVDALLQKAKARIKAAMETYFMIFVSMRFLSLKIAREVAEAGSRGMRFTGAPWKILRSLKLRLLKKTVSVSSRNPLD